MFGADGRWSGRYRLRAGWKKAAPPSDAVSAPGSRQSPSYRRSSAASSKRGKLMTSYREYREYKEALLGTLWAWADRNHSQELDGIKRRGRPPVLAREFKSKNVLVPPDELLAEQINSVVPPGRHRHFCSFKSSEALTQSVFGAVKACRRLDLLENVTSECGRKAFFHSSEGINLEFEKKVRWLKEPRPTSVDVFLSGAQCRVAVECKFTERKFGACSRTDFKALSRQDRSSEYCDGNYRIQSGRVHRCALTEIGIRYWEYLPHLFHWPSDRDHAPCPFGSVYQLARNAMAATVMPDGRLAPTGGHVLVVYDAHNPEFGEGEKAREQLESAEAACRVPGLVRRLSWQRLLTALSRAPELDYLIVGLAGKYGLKPE